MLLALGKVVDTGEIVGELGVWGVGVWFSASASLSATSSSSIIEISRIDGLCERRQPGKKIEIRKNYHIPVILLASEIR